MNPRRLQSDTIFSMRSGSVYSLSAMISLDAVGRDGSALQAVWQGIENPAPKEVPEERGICPPYSVISDLALLHAHAGAGKTVPARR